MVYSFELIKHANIRYRDSLVVLSRCELFAMLWSLGVTAEIREETLGGSRFLTVECRDLNESEIAFLSGHSSFCFMAENRNGLLRPLPVSFTGYLPEDLPEVLKYKGKTSAPFMRMMINTAVIQLGLQNACVRIGNELIPISLGQHYGDKEPWSMYAKWITDETPGLFETGSIQGIDSLTGDTSQYVSFMIDPAGANETFQNEVGDSQVYATVINQGAELGAEISFLTNSSKNKVDDAIINIAGGAVNAAEAVLSNMTAGVGRFTAAVAGSFARTFVGNHCIYPQIFKSHTSTVSRDITIHLNASGVYPYSYLMDILVPYFFILGMVLPQLSTNNAASYSFPPLVQANIPGIWGTRLGMVTSVTVNKNQSGKDLSIHGFPLSVDVTMTVTDLQHVLMTSPQDKASAFLNNHTMFDYIAICAGVDKYRPNGAIRLTSRLALMANTIQNIDSVIGNAVLSDVSSWFNRLSGNAR